MFLATNQVLICTEFFVIKKRYILVIAKIKKYSIKAPF